MISAAALFALTACGGGSDHSTAADGPIKLKVALQPVADFGALWVGDQEGIFKKHGFELSFPTVASAGSGQIAQLLNGQVSIVAGSIGNVITAVSQGVPIRALGPFSIDYDKGGRTLHSLIVKKGGGVSSPKDLDGKTVGINTLKDSWESELRETIAKDGGDPSKVKVVAIPFADQPAALRQGRVDAIVTLQPFASQLLSQPGFTSLGDTMSIALGVPDGSSGDLFVAKSFLAKHPGFAKEWRAALNEASAFANKHPDLTRATISKKIGVPAAALAKAPLPTYSGEPNSDVIATWGRLLQKYGMVSKAPSAEDILAK